MSAGMLWALVCALLWSAGMIYFDAKKKKRK